MAEREGFEPPDPFGSTVFKTAAIDHSATSPSQNVVYYTLFQRGNKEGRIFFDSFYELSLFDAAKGCEGGDDGL